MTDVIVRVFNFGSRKREQCRFEKQKGSGFTDKQIAQKDIAGKNVRITTTNKTLREIHRPETQELMVGSCSNKDNSVEILFRPFLYSVWIILRSESVAAETKQDFAENLRVFFVCLFSLC